MSACRCVHTLGRFAEKIERLSQSLEYSSNARQKVAEVLEVWTILAKGDFETCEIEEVDTICGRNGPRRYWLHHKSLTVFYAADGEQVCVIDGFFDDEIGLEGYQEEVESFGWSIVYWSI